MFLIWAIIGIERVVVVHYFCGYAQAALYLFQEPHLLKHRVNIFYFKRFDGLLDNENTRSKINTGIIRGRSWYSSFFCTLRWYSFHVA